jgi:hypothetical protein
VLIASLLVGIAQQPLEACFARMPDYATWREAPNQQWDYHRSGERGAVTLFGAEHSRDPKHPQFARLEQAFRTAAPTLVFYEGPDRGEAASAEETIRTMGEPGWLRFAAKQSKVAVRTLEPNPQQQLGMLMGEFPLDEVLLFFVLRDAAIRRERDGLAGTALDAGTTALLQRARQMAGAGNIALPFTDIAGLEAAAARYWPGRDWRTLPRAWFTPGSNDGETGGQFVGAINRADSRNRDRNLVAQIVEAVKGGERVFVVIGRNHVPMLAPALDCALAPG